MGINSNGRPLIKIISFYTHTYIYDKYTNYIYFPFFITCFILIILRILFLSSFTLLLVLVIVYLPSYSGAMLLLSYHIISYIIFKSFVLCFMPVENLEMDKGNYKGPKALYSLCETVVYKGPKALLSLYEIMTIYKGPKALLSLCETMTIYKGPKAL